jgi:hypothetical protein
MNNTIAWTILGIITVVLFTSVFVALINEMPMELPDEDDDGKDWSKL